MQSTDDDAASDGHQASWRVDDWLKAAGFPFSKPMLYQEIHAGRIDPRKIGRNTVILTAPRPISPTCRRKSAPRSVSVAAGARWRREGNSPASPPARCRGVGKSSKPSPRATPPPAGMTPSWPCAGGGPIGPTPTPTSSRSPPPRRRNGGTRARPPALPVKAEKPARPAPVRPEDLEASANIHPPTDAIATPMEPVP